MARRSAGVVLYRVRDRGLEVLLVHPGGPFWARRDEGAWSIPKGEVEAGQDPVAVARREYAEELGAAPPEGTWTPLRPVRLRGGKVVVAWAVRGDFDVATATSATFEMEWPPRSGRRATFPEVDRAAWFPLDEARRRVNAGQAPLLDELEGLARAGRGGPEPGPTDGAG